MAAEEKLLMCALWFYRIEYVINPWMEGNIGRTDAAAARRQWERLRDALGLATQPPPHRSVTVS